MLFLFLGFLTAWIVPRIGCMGALGSILLLYGLITMVGTAGVFVWSRYCSRCAARCGQRSPIRHERGEASRSGVRLHVRVGERR
jgi:hypothetical protein